MNKKTLRRGRRTNAGFTLIELLVVVLIIGILAAIAVPQYFSVIEKGHFAEATNCIDTIKNAEQRYGLSGSGYTATNGSNIATAGNAAGNVLDTGCQGMKYFAGTITAAGVTNFTITMTRNATSFSATSGAPAGYTVTMAHTDGAVDTWGGTVPAAWLPQ